MSASGAAERLIMRGGIFAGIGFLARFGARLLFLFVAAQLYGAALFGAYALAVAVVELAAAAGGVGMRKMLFQFLDRNEASAGARPAGHVLLDAALLVLAASGGIVLAIWAIVLVLPKGSMAQNTAAILVMVAPMLAGQALLDLLAAATRWRNMMRYEVLSRSLVEPYAALAAAALGYAAGLRESGLALSFWAGTLAAIAVSLFGLRRAFGPLGLAGYVPSVRRLTGMARSTAPNTGSDVANALFSRLDLYMVGLFLGEAPAGVYGVARQLRTPVRQIRQSLDTLLTPAAARTVEVDGPQGAGEALASASRFILALTLPVLILLFAVGEPLLAAFGGEFTAGYRAMLIVTAAELIQAAFGLSGLIFVYRQPWLGLQLTLIWMVVGAAAGCALIPAAGIEGAAASVLFAYAGMAFHRRLVLRRRFGVSIPIRHSLGPLLAALLAVAAATILSGLMNGVDPLVSASLTAAAALAVYAAALFGWCRMTGERLSMRGFQHSASAQQGT